MEFLTDQARWTAVSTRNLAAAHSFVYCVTTTRIYCRPSCPSRLARRANVIFHSTAVAAEAAGFRPCKRCQPSSSSLSSSERLETKSSCLLGGHHLQGSAIEDACRFIRGSVEEPRLRELAARAGLTESYFHRVFKKLVGATPREYRARYRPSGGGGGGGGSGYGDSNGDTQTTAVMPSTSGAAVLSETLNSSSGHHLNANTESADSLVNDDDDDGNSTPGSLDSTDPPSIQDFSIDSTDNNPLAGRLEDWMLLDESSGVPCEIDFEIGQTLWTLDQSCVQYPFEQLDSAAAAEVDVFDQFLVFSPEPDQFVPQACV